MADNFNDPNTTEHVATATADTSAGDTGTAGHDKP